MKRAFEKQKLQPQFLAPEFQLVNTQGKPVALSDYRGQPVVLVFTRGFA